MSIKLRVTECVYCKACKHPIADSVWEGVYSEIEDVKCTNCDAKEAAIDMALTVARRFTEMGQAMQASTTKSTGFTWSDTGDQSKIKGCPDEFQGLLKIFHEENKNSNIPVRW